MWRPKFIIVYEVVLLGPKAIDLAARLERIIIRALFRERRSSSVLRGIKI